jgi:hypothetical protein
MLPSQFFALDIRERAAIMAFIDLKIDSDKKRNSRLKSAASKRR